MYTSCLLSISTRNDASCVTANYTFDPESTQGIFRGKLGIYVKNAVVVVYGIDGVKVAKQTMASHATTLEMLVSGFYIVSVKVENEKPVTAKVIIR